MARARQLLLLSTWTAAGVLTAALAFALPLRSEADPNIGVPMTPTGAVGPPVEIDECKLLYSGNDVAGESDGISLKFTNDSKLTADLINFKITAGSEGGMIRDVGTFTPGIEITHRYREGSGHLMFSPLLSHVALDCSVAAVHFTDGSVWQASSVKPADPAPSASSAPLVKSARPLGLAPAALTFAGVGPQYDQYLTIYDAVGLGAIHRSGSCARIVRVRTVQATARSAALRVSPITAGRCSITIADAANNAASIPVVVNAVAVSER